MHHSIWGTASLVSYDDAASSAEQIVFQQGLRTATAFTVFSMWTNSWDWKSDHYVTNGVYGQWIDWSHSAGGPGGVLASPAMFWASPYEAPLGALTGQRWDLLWDAVHRIESFPVRSVLERASENLAKLLGPEHGADIHGQIADIAGFLEARTPLLSPWIANSEFEAANEA
jgi:hypothetical protein